MPAALIFDLDDTLLSTRERRIAALNYVGRARALQHIPHIRCLATLTPATAPMEYGIDHALRQCQIAPADAPTIHAAWYTRFLSAAGLYQRGKLLSTPRRGAVTAVKRAVAKGYHVIYLTGRHHDPAHHDSLRRGTIDELSTYGFPLGKEAELIMKTAPHSAQTPPLVRMINDAVYKEQTIAALKRQYTLKATFDDGVKNVAVFQRALPHATHFGVTVNFPCHEFPAKTVCIDALDDPKVTAFFK